MSILQINKHTLERLQNQSQRQSQTTPLQQLPKEIHNQKNNDKIVENTQMNLPEQYIFNRQRSFLIKNQVAWTDILRQKQRRIEIQNLNEQLRKANSDAEIESIQETIYILKSEIDQLAII